MSAKRAYEICSRYVLLLLKGFPAWKLMINAEKNLSCPNNLVDWQQPTIRGANDKALGYDKNRDSSS